MEPSQHEPAGKNTMQVVTSNTSGLKFEIIDSDTSAFVAAFKEMHEVQAFIKGKDTDDFVLLKLADKRIPTDCYPRIVRGSSPYRVM
jgi:hypothetical protein